MKRLGFLSALLIVASLSGCSDSYVTNYGFWPGIAAIGHDSLYSSIKWPRDRGDAPMFSIQLPDGTLLTPDQFTIAVFDSFCALKFPQYGPSACGFGEGTVRRLWYHDLPANPLRRGRGVGTAYAEVQISFNEYNQLQTVSTHGTLVVGNRDGTKRVQLPATLAELIEVFGEPTAWHSDTTWVHPSFGFDCC